LHPVRLLPLAFAGLIVVGTILLLLPFTRAGQRSPDFLEAFFTATSAATVTGLATVDIGEYWSLGGQIVIVALVEIGGIGIIAMATVLGLFIGGRLGLRTQMLAQMDMHVVSLGEVRPLFRRVTVMVLGFQSVLATALTVRYRDEYFDSWAESAWHGIFDAVMAFNNAGFSLNGDGLERYAGDAGVILPLSIGVFIGAVGFPVLAELYRDWRRPRRWTIHTRLTVWGSFLLLGIGVLGFLLLEWSNPGTIGSQSLQEKLITSVEAGVMPRSGGLASIDWGQTLAETQGMAVIMMFIGGGSASTAGGIKITTFLLLAFVILAELRGDPEVHVGVRSISGRTVRTALSIALIAVLLVVSGTMLVLLSSDATFAEALFEAVSAFGTTGLSTGLTTELDAFPQLVLIGLMFVGRVGTITAASAFVLRRRQPRYHLPEEQPIIG